MKLVRAAYAAALLGLQIACTQAGDTNRSPRAPAASADVPCDAMRDANCPAPSTGGGPALEPAVPPVPASPIKTDCARLPTQVERDTCTNRKESTG